MSSDADRIGHLLRRFSFGSSLKERERFAGLGPDALLERLLTTTTQDSDLPPMRLAFIKGEEAQPGAWRFRLHWVYEMLTTDQPLREKAALFWHNHFAVHEEKVGDGLAMLKYVQSLRSQPLGSFRDLLKSMVTSVAIMKQLDFQMLSKTWPNENFARELLELYTLGEGHYSEDDIKQLAHVLTGHGYIDLFYRMGDNNDQRLIRMMKDDMWGSAYCYAPDLHDAKPRAFLGREIRDLDDALTVLAEHPRTAEFICTKLWRFFGSAIVKPDAVKAMTRAWNKSGGVIREVLHEMAKTKDFWAEDVVRGLPKNPYDFVVGIARAQSAGDDVKSLFKPGRPNEPVPKPFEDALSEIVYHAQRIGFDLLYVPTVAGYEGGSAWINSETMARKAEFHGIRVAEAYQEKGETKWKPAKNLLNVAEAVYATQPRNAADVARQINEFYDAGLDQAQLKVLEAAVKRHGDLAPKGNRDWMGWQMLEVSKLLRLTPQFSLC